MVDFNRSSHIYTNVLKYDGGVFTCTNMFQQVKKAVKERFGVTNSQTEAMLDGEDKLKMKGRRKLCSEILLHIKYM